TIDPPEKMIVAKNSVRHDRQYASRIIAPVRPVAIAPEERGRLEEGGNKLRDRLAKLGSVKPEQRAEAEGFLKGIAWALRYDDTLTPADAALLKKAQERATERTTALEAGEAPWRAKKGKVARAYVSAVDGSVQPYGVIVPAKYERGKPIRLDVVLHGS